MSNDDEHVRRLLTESLDAELGARLDGPGTVTAAADRPARANRRWLLPVAAAAVVAAVAVAVLAITGTGTDKTPSGGDSTGTVVTCKATGPGDVAQDRSTLLTRAKAVSDGTPTVRVDGSTVSITVPGASRHAVAGLCASTSLELRPVIAPAVGLRSGPAGNPDPLGDLGFAAPTTEAAWDALTPAQQHKIDNRLATASCRPVPAGSVAPVVACMDEADNYGPGDVVLLGATVLDGTSVTSATALAPNARTAAWTVNLTFDRHGAQAWSAFTGAHHTSDASSSATLSTCASYSTPCEDFVAFVSDGRAISVPLTNARLSSQTEISGAFTKKSAQRLATALQQGQLAVPLKLVGVRPAR